MRKVHCEIHNTDIVIYGKTEEHLFQDNNIVEVAIFTNENGVKYLKRLVIGECDENCPTIKELLGTEIIQVSGGEFYPRLFLAGLAEHFTPLERFELAKRAPSFTSELQYGNFGAMKMIIDYLYSQGELTQEQVTIIKNLFLEQGVNLDDYSN